jgi:hypothetical protein
MILVRVSDSVRAVVGRVGAFYGGKAEEAALVADSWSV